MTALPQDVVAELKARIAEFEQQLQASHAENARLFDVVQARTHELAESLEQQTATSEVLGVISRSAGDLAPVFDAMLGKAMQLCRASFGVLNTFDGTQFHTAAAYGLPPAYAEFRRGHPLEYGPSTAPARLLKGEAFVEVCDLLESEAYRTESPTDGRSSISAVRAACSRCRCSRTSGWLATS